MAHRACAEAYFLNCSKSDINSLLRGRQLTAHREQIKKRRQVLDRVVEVVRVIGKRGLSYRHEDNEAAYTLEDSSLDHGNFLEMILLLGKYDVALKEHLSDIIHKSKKLHESASGSRGRGSLVTLLPLSLCCVSTCREDTEASLHSCHHNLLTMSMCGATLMCSISFFLTPLKL